MTKTYTKIILGIATFLRTLLGPISVVVRPLVQHADVVQQDVKPTVSLVYNIAHAAESSSINDLAITLESVLKVFYVLLWPALFIAGLAMDNSLVYGEIFGLDKALFQFWQIMKNFANFALGFIFVWSILQYIFDIKSGKAANPKDLIVKLLIAAIGINTSWFIMGVLIDLSTALTVGIGGLPLQLMGSNDVGNKPLFGTVASIKLNQAVGKKDSTPVFHTWPGSRLGESDGRKYLLPCYFKDRKVVWGDERRSVFELSETAGSATGTQIGFNQVVQEYCIAGGNIIGSGAYGAAGSPDVYDTSAMTPVYNASLTAFRTAAGCDNSQLCQTITTFTKKTEGYQGAFYTLYASLMNLSTIHVAVPKSTISITMEMLIKIIVALAYLIPLLILAVILIMRVGYLWMVIAFSPFIILASMEGFGGVVKKLDGSGLSLGDIKTKFNLKNVISLLLLPVVVTFVMSLSIVFLSSLSEGLTKNGSAAAMGIYQRQEGSYKCYDVAITNICLDMPTQDIGLGIGDYFSRTIMNLFGIALMWFAVMAALKSAEFTQELAGKIEKLGGNLVSSINFIPVPGGGFTNLGAVKNLEKDMHQRLGRSAEQGQSVFSEAMTGAINDMKNKDAIVNEAIGKTMKDIQDPKTTFAAKQGIVKNALGNFAAQESMNFGQADQSTAFANMLAQQAGFQYTFSKGQDLFTTDKGHAVLRKWFENPDNDTLKQLGAMYSARNTDQESWENYKKQIWPTATSPAQPTTPNPIKLGTDNTAPFYVENDKIIVNKNNPDTLIKNTSDVNDLIAEINKKLENKDKKLNVTELTKTEYKIGDKKYAFKLNEKENKIVFNEISTPTSNNTKQDVATNSTPPPVKPAEKKDNTTTVSNNKQPTTATQDKNKDQNNNTKPNP